MQEFESKLKTSFQNLWRYETFYPDVFLESEKLYIETKFSPLEKVSFAGREIYLKREDKNKTGSLKTRGLAYELSVALKQNYDKFVLSTSGNAGITAAKYLQKYGGKLVVVTKTSIPDRKIHALIECTDNLLIADNPPHIANYIDKKFGYKNLRPSRDDKSIPGYYSLGFEIYEQLGSSPDQIFIYSSSGSSFIGIYESFRILKNHGEINKLPAMYAVRWDRIRTFRDKEVLQICEETGGAIVYITKEEFDEVEFATSYEGRATLKGVEKEAQDGKVVAVLTGRKYDEIEEKNVDLKYIKSLSDVDDYMKSLN